jgi:NAD-dependent deacetylase
MDRELNEFRRMLEAAQKVVAFTGAGISTESGIPDFRSPGGIWSKMKPIYFQDFVASEEARVEAWRRKFESDPVMRAAAPNRGHRAVARLVADGKVTHVVTQNIDGLHQASGIPEHRVIELHGNSTYAHCLDCQRRYELEAIRPGFEASGKSPRCDDCGGFVKTATVAFGQSMPPAAMIRAEEAILGCDMCLVAGSSLVVYPAAGFPELAKRRGARLVILNREPTDMDPIADLVLHREIGDTLGSVVGNN